MTRGVELYIQCHCMEYSCTSSATAWSTAVHPVPLHGSSDHTAPAPATNMCVYKCVYIYVQRSSSPLSKYHATPSHLLIHIQSLEVEAAVQQHKRVKSITWRLLPLGSKRRGSKDILLGNARGVDWAVVLDDHLVQSEGTGLVTAKHVHACVCVRTRKSSSRGQGREDCMSLMCQYLFIVLCASV